MKNLVTVGLLAATLSGCAAFCDSNDVGCINRANAISAGVAAGSVALLAGAAAAAAARPVYYAPPPPVVYVCRWPYC